MEYIAELSNNIINIMENPNYTAKAAMLIRRPVSEVFEAFINPEITTKFWFTHSSGRLEEGKEATWSWEMYNLNVPLIVLTIDQNEKIVIQWGSGQHESKVEWIFKSLGDAKTYVTIINYDFKGVGEELISQIRDSTGGFTWVLAGLKTYLEHNIELNLIADAHPKELG